MKLKFHGMRIVAGDDINLDTVFNCFCRVDQPYEFGSCRRFSGCITRADGWREGWLITLRDDKQYTAYQEVAVEEGEPQPPPSVGLHSLPEGQEFAGYNFFLLNPRLRGIVTTARDGMGTAEFFRMLQRLAKQSHEEALQDAIEVQRGKRKRLGRAERKNLEDRFRIECSRLVTDEGLEQIISGWQNFTSLTYRVSKFVPDRKFGGSLREKVRAKETTLFLNTDSPFASLKKAVLDTFKELANRRDEVEKATLSGINENNDKQTIPAWDEIAEFGSHDIDTLVANGSIDQGNILASNIWQLMRETMLGHATVFDIDES